jgi:hypothetical protein
MLLLTNPPHLSLQHLRKLLQRGRNPIISPIRLEQHFPRRLIGAQVRDGAWDGDLVAAGVPGFLGVAACVAAHPEVEAVGGGVRGRIEGGDVFWGMLVGGRGLGERGKVPRTRRLSSRWTWSSSRRDMVSWLASTILRVGAGCWLSEVGEW